MTAESRTTMDLTKSGQKETVPANASKKGKTDVSDPNTYSRVNGVKKKQELLLRLDPSIDNANIPENDKELIAMYTTAYEAMFGTGYLQKEQPTRTTRAAKRGGGEASPASLKPDKKTRKRKEAAEAEDEVTEPFKGTLVLTPQQPGEDAAAYSSTAMWEFARFLLAEGGAAMRNYLDELFTKMQNEVFVPEVLPESWEQTGVLVAAQITASFKAEEARALAATAAIAAQVPATAPVGFSRAQHMSEILDLKQDHRADIKSVKEAAQKELLQVKEEHKVEIQQLKKEHKMEIQQLKEEHKMEIQQLKEELRAELKEAKKLREEPQSNNNTPS